MNEHAEVLSAEERERLGEEIACISSQIDAATHRLLACIRRFDEAGGWVAQGALSCAHWLTWRIGLGPGAAREYVRVARALADLPQIDQALRVGKLSYCKVRALTRCADSQNEATLLEWAESCTGAQLEKTCAKYRRVLRYEGLIPVDDPEFRYVRKRETASGMVRIVAQLQPEEAAIVWKALEVARAAATKSAGDVSAETSEGSDVSAETSERPEGERRASGDRADGLLWLAEAALGGQVGEKASPSPVEVVVHVEQSELSREPEGVLEDGRALEPETTARLLCDSAIVEVVEDEHGTPLDVGRRTRTIPASLKRALRTRDGGCRFPACDRARTDGHHVVPWSQGGPTSLTNLVSLCRRHHRFVHELGWKIEARAGNEILFFDTHGAVVTTGERREALAGDAVEAIRADLADEGINIDAGTAHPVGTDRADYGMAVEALVYDQVRREGVSAETS